MRRSCRNVSVEKDGESCPLTMRYYVTGFHGCIPPACMVEYKKLSHKL
jgi:hypothetical protein